MTFQTCFRIALTFVCAGMITSIRAAELAQATISPTQLNPTTWQYDISLDDIGTTNIGTLWFSWIPGEEFMPTSPTNIVSPPGWTENITGGFPGDGFAIQWVDGGAPLTPGHTLTGFQFDSTTSPTAIAGNSPFFPGTPILTSFVYINGPLSDAGDRFVAQVAQTSSTPEPATDLLVASCVGSLIVFFALRRRTASGIRAADSPK